MSVNYDESEDELPAVGIDHLTVTPSNWDKQYDDGVEDTDLPYQD